MSAQVEMEARYVVLVELVLRMTWRKVVVRGLRKSCAMNLGDEIRMR